MGPVFARQLPYNRGTWSGVTLALFPGCTVACMGSDQLKSRKIRDGKCHGSQHSNPPSPHPISHILHYFPHKFLSELTVSGTMYEASHHLFENNKRAVGCALFKYFNWKNIAINYALFYKRTFAIILNEDWFLPYAPELLTPPQSSCDALKNFHAPLIKIGHAWKSQGPDDFGRSWRRWGGQKKISF